jgi:hypothetical protein
MANICSFAVNGIMDLKAAMLAQVTTNADFSIETTLKQIIMDAKIHRTNNPIFYPLNLPTLPKLKDVTCCSQKNTRSALPNI